MSDEKSSKKSHKKDDGDDLAEKVAKLQKEKEQEEKELKEKLEKTLEAESEIKKKTEDSADHSGKQRSDDSGSQNTELEKLKTELEQAQKQIAALTETSQRAVADLQNFRRRSEENREAFAQFANAELILALLPTVDNFRRGLQAVTEDLKNHPVIKGFEAIEKALEITMEKAGLKAIESVGKTFDAHVHEALLEAPGEKGLIIQELERGYLLGEKVLKPAKVIVGNGEKN